MPSRLACGCKWNEASEMCLPSLQVPWRVVEDGVVLGEAWGLGVGLAEFTLILLRSCENWTRKSGRRRSLSGGRRLSVWISKAMGHELAETLHSTGPARACLDTGRSPLIAALPRLVIAQHEGRRSRSVGRASSTGSIGREQVGAFAG